MDRNAAVASTDTPGQERNCGLHVCPVFPILCVNWRVKRQIGQSRMQPDGSGAVFREELY